MESTNNTNNIFSPVMVYKLKEYNQQKADVVIEKIFSLWGEADKLTSDTKVTIKPNLLMRRSPEQATTTHPVIISAVVTALKSRGVTKITIADSPGGPYTVPALKSIYKGCGLNAVGEDMLNTDVGYQSVPSKNGVIVDTFNLINPIVDADVIISIGKMKTHAMTTLSGGVKNLFGCVPGLQKPEFHYQLPENTAFCQMLVDLAATVNPNLTIIDAVLAMEGDGPSGGTPKDVGYVVASESPFVLDMILSGMMKIKLDDVWTIKHSQTRGFAPNSLEEVTVIGDSYSDIGDFQLPASKSLDFSDHIPFFLKPLAKMLKRLFVTRPIIRTSECVGCGKCAESCPPQTIQIIDKKAVIDYSNCISCFCCHEMCPYKVIDMKTRGIWRK